METLRYALQTETITPTMALALAEANVRAAQAAFDAASEALEQARMARVAAFKARDALKGLHY